MGWFGRSRHPEEQLSAYLDGELNAREAESLQTHLQGCVSCSALLEELRAGKSLLAAMPRQTPRRSFVLGAEYAREAPGAAGVRPATGPRRPVLALAPALALTLFGALLVVDFADFSSTSRDGEMQTTAVESLSSQDDADERNGGEAGAAALAPAAEQDAAEDGDAETPSEAPQALSAEAAQDMATEEAARAEGAPEPPAEAQDGATALAPESEDDGISALRVLQILAAGAFIASALYVFVLPRLSERLSR